MPQLPLRTQELIEKVENLAKTRVSWECCPELGGLMGSTIKNGVPTIQYREWSEAGATEELMHLQLMLSGVQLSAPGNRDLVAQTATMLQNVVHHHVIFPALFELGYKPRDVECNGISKQLSVLENSSDLQCVNSDRDLEALMAILYARAQLDCGTADVITRLDGIYSTSALSGARRMGIRIVSVIREQSDPSPQACCKTLAECLDLLGLSGVIGISQNNA